MLSCEVIKDLLPLYYDGVCTPDSFALVHEHLQKCEKCRNGCDFIVADFQAVSEYLVVTVPCGFVTVGQMESFSRASRAMAFSSSRWILLPSELFILPKIR